MIMLMNPHTGTVLSETEWEQIFNESTPKEWGGENFSDAELIAVYWHPEERSWISEQDANERGLTLDDNSASVVWFACTCEEHSGELDNGSFYQGEAYDECMRMVREGMSYVGMVQCDKDGEIISGPYTSMSFWLKTNIWRKFSSLDEVRAFTGKKDIVEDEDFYIESDYDQK